MKVGGKDGVKVREKNGVMVGVKVGGKIGGKGDTRRGDGSEERGVPRRASPCRE